MATDEPRLYIAFYTDEDVDGRLAAQLRAKGYDAISTFEVGNTTIKDPVQLGLSLVISNPSILRGKLCEKSRFFH